MLMSYKWPTRLTYTSHQRIRLSDSELWIDYSHKKNFFLKKLTQVYS